MSKKDLISFLRKEKEWLNKAYDDENDFFAGYITGRIATIDIILEELKAHKPVRISGTRKSAG